MPADTARLRERTCVCRMGILTICSLGSKSCTCNVQRPCRTSAKKNQKRKWICQALHEGVNLGIWNYMTSENQTSCGRPEVSEPKSSQSPGWYWPANLPAHLYVLVLLNAFQGEVLVSRPSSIAHGPTFSSIMYSCKFAEAYKALRLRKAHEHVVEILQQGHTEPFGSLHLAWRLV